MRHLHILTVSFPEGFPPDHIAKLKCDYFYSGFPKCLKAMVAYLKASANEKMYTNYRQAAKEAEKEEAVVMYGSAVLFLGLPRGIGSHKYCRGALQYTMLVFGFSSLCTLRWNIQRHVYCIQCIFLFIITIYF